MKYFFVFITLFFLNQQASSQLEFWGMTSSGGINFQGVLFKTDRTGKKETVMHYFDTSTGAYPKGSLIQATNGKLYGLTGTDGTGAVIAKFFEFNPISKNYRIILRFDSILSSAIVGSPFQAQNGKIYFLTTYKLMEYNPFKDSIKAVATLPNNIRGSASYLMQALNGNIYFATQSSITTGLTGALFSFNPSSYSLNKIFNFYDDKGVAAYGSFIEWSPNLLYGTFSSGNDSLQYGGIFTYDILTNAFTKKRLFGSIGGSGAYGGLTKVGNKLYGATNAGGGWQDNGLIYKYTPSTNFLDTVNTFDYINNQNFYDSGHQTYITCLRGWGTELLAANGKLYGLTYISSLFSIDTATEVVTPHIYFYDSSGQNPRYAHLIQTCTKPYYLNAIPDTVHVLQGQPVRFNISTPNTDTFRWVKDSTNLLPLQKDSTLKIDTAKLTDMGWYTCRLTNECGDSITRRFFLKVDIVTPLGLVFSGRVRGTSAVLQWQIGNTDNTSYYELQRSPNGVGNSFVPIGKINATNNQTSYTYSDEQIFASPLSLGEGSGVRYCYRLREIAKDGSSSFSNIICLQTNATSQLTITPNPAKDKILISFGRQMSGIVKFELLGSNGQIVMNKETKNIASQILSVAHLPAGVYTLRVSNGDEVWSEKVVVE